MTGKGKLSTTNKLLGLREERCDRQKRRDDVNDAKLRRIVENIEAPDLRLILRSKKKGFYLDVRGNMVTGTVLAGTKFSAFCAYDMMLPPLTVKKFDCYYRSFSVHHRIICSHRKLIIVHHNEVHDELLYLAQQDFPSNCVCCKPLIHQGRSRSEEEVRHEGCVLET